MIADLVSLFFPNNCAGCSTSLLKNEKTVCLKCQFALPYTRFHNDRNNRVNKLFWGKSDVHSATSLVFFEKDTRIQNLMHELKYNGRTAVGDQLGTWLGQELMETEEFKSVNTIIPVPLHPKKQRIRGYNQSDFIADGIGNAMNVEVDKRSLVRTRFSETQTRKSRFNRWENVSTIFKVKHPKELENKHILLVDDVVTTGSTLDACAKVLLELPNVKVSVATIACA